MYLVFSTENKSKTRSGKHVFQYALWMPCNTYIHVYAHIYIIYTIYIAKDTQNTIRRVES